MASLQLMHHQLARSNARVKRLKYSASSSRRHGVYIPRRTARRIPSKSAASTSHPTLSAPQQRQDDRETCSHVFPTPALDKLNQATSTVAPCPEHTRHTYRSKTTQYSNNRRKRKRF